MVYAQQLRFESFLFDPVNQCLWNSEQMINLGPKAFAVLSYLITHPGRLVTKEELLQAVWPDVCVTDSVLKVRVGEVRKALDDPVQDPRIIETLHRRGYRFIATVMPELNSGDGAMDPALLPERSGALIGREQVLAQLHKHLY